jgi:hypothetical protein
MADTRNTTGVTPPGPSGAPRSTPDRGAAGPGPARPSVELPDWMREPDDPKPTLRWRIGARLRRMPGAQALRRARWRWETRTRLHRQFPIMVALLAIPLAFITIMIMISVVYWLYARA